MTPQELRVHFEKTRQALQQHGEAIKQLIADVAQLGQRLNELESRPAPAESNGHDAEGENEGSHEEAGNGY